MVKLASRSATRSVFVLFNESNAFTKPDISAVACKFFEFSVSFVGVIEIVITPKIWRLSDSTSAVIDGSIETPVMRAARVVVPQVPFAKHSRCVASTFQYVRNRDFLRMQERATGDRMPHSSAQ